MDEKLEKAIQTANYMATLTNQRKLALEEFNQSLIYYFGGASFTVTRELISFVKALVDTGNEFGIVLDDNSIPVKIDDIKEFYNNLFAVYSEASLLYLNKYNEIKKKRRVQDLVSL